jgi:dihydrofolate synthase/folylpolyglutamate synthase
MVESILRAAGRRTGLFTSPHLNRFPERVRIDGEPVSSEDFAAGVAAVRAAAERVSARLPQRRFLTFDVLTALGFLLFRDKAVDVQIVEVGLGGLLDSTNVFETKECAVITSIGLEHTEILGSTIAAIAAQKAGIIVAGGPAVMAPQRESAADVIRAVAKEKGAPLTEAALACRLRRDSAGADGQSFHLRTGVGDYEAKLPLLGKHQLENAATAVLAVEALAAAGIAVGAAAVKAGLEALKWPARIEALKQRPLLVVDAAHTADSARVLGETLAEYLHVKEATLVVGLMGDKDIDGLADAIAPLARRVIATRADHPRALAPAAVARPFRERGIETQVEPGVGAAVESALRLSTASEAVVILGSVALAGEARAHVLGLERDPPIDAGPRER